MRDVHEAIRTDLDSSCSMSVSSAHDNTDDASMVSGTSTGGETTISMRSATSRGRKVKEGDDECSQLSDTSLASIL